MAEVTPLPFLFSINMFIGDYMKWTIRKTPSGYVVKFKHEADNQVFPNRALALAYINHRVLSSMGL